MSEPIAHEITVVESPYFSTPFVYVGACSCGQWRSVKMFTEADAMAAGQRHVNVMAAMAVMTAEVLDPVQRRRLIEEGLADPLPPRGDRAAYAAWCRRRASTGQLIRYDAIVAGDAEGQALAEKMIADMHAHADGLKRQSGPADPC